MKLNQEYIISIVAITALLTGTVNCGKDVSIFAKFNDGSTLAFDLPSGATIADLKRKACSEKPSLDFDKTGIIFGGTVRDEAQSLADAGIGMEAAVEVREIYIFLTEQQQRTQRRYTTPGYVGSRWPGQQRIRFDLTQDLKQQFESLTGESMDEFRDVWVCDIKQELKDVFLKNSAEGQAKRHQFLFRHTTQDVSTGAADPFIERSDDDFSIGPHYLNSADAKNKIELRPSADNHLVLRFEKDNHAGWGATIVYEYDVPSNIYLLLETPGVRRLLRR